MNVLIIGAGLIGSSIGLALTKHGDHVYLRDNVSSHALVAASLGAGSVEAPPADDVGLVIVAVPPALIGQVVAAALAEFASAVVTDVASVKSPVLIGLYQTGGGLERYVGSHPMAGSDRSGPLTARADLFVDCIWVVTPHFESSPFAIAAVSHLAEVCGAHIETMTPAEHDIAVAEVSHVPQIISSLMAGNLDGLPSSHLRLAGQGVRDVTRLAGSEPGMWSQIITANRAAISDRLRRIVNALQVLIGQLGSPPAVAAFLELGGTGVRALPGKHGRAAADYARVVVEIPDSPGALGRLFTDVELVGVNVEDLSIEHDRQRAVGYMSMAVEPEKAESLAQAMAARGWSIRD